MNQYNIFQAIFLSFYSKNLYRDVAINWGGKAFGYLFFIVVLAWIFPTFYIQLSINKNYAKHSQLYVNQLPVLTFNQGTLSTPEKRPYIVTEPGTSNIVMIIDTSGRYTNLEQAKATMLVTDKEIITRRNTNETRIYQIPTDFNKTVDPVVGNEYLKKFLSYAWIFIYIFGVIFIYIYRIIQALIYSLIGKIFAAIAKVSLSYTRILALSMVAVTPAILLGTLFQILKIYFPFQLIFYFILTMFYLFYGIVANKNKEKI